jgi:hypothetical protein
MFHEESPKFIDWQCLSLAPGTLDVVRFLVLCLDSSVLEKNEIKYLKKYSEGLPNVEFDTIFEMYKTCIWNEINFSITIGKIYKGVQENGVDVESLGRSFNLSFLIIERSINAIHRHFKK